MIGAARAVLMAGAVAAPPAFVGEVHDSPDTGDQFSLDISALTAAGRVALAWAHSSGTDSLATPAGWTLEATVNTQAKLFSRVLDGTETTVLFDWSSNIPEHAAVIVVYSGVDGVAPIDASASNTGSFSNNNTITAPSVTTTQPDTHLVCFYAIEDVNTGVTGTPPTGQTERADFQGASGDRPFTYASDEPVEAAGATGTKTMTLSSSLSEGTWRVISVALAPA